MIFKNVNFKVDIKLIYEHSNYFVLKKIWFEFKIQFNYLDLDSQNSKLVL